MPPSEFLGILAGSCVKRSCLVQDDCMPLNTFAISSKIASTWALANISTCRRRAPGPSVPSERDVSKISLQSFRDQLLTLFGAGAMVVILRPENKVVVHEFVWYERSMNRGPGEARGATAGVDEAESCVHV